MSGDELTDEPIAKRRCKRIKNIELKDVSDIDQKWTYDEKVELYNHLLKYGSSNTELLSGKLPRKTEDAVKSYISSLKKSSRCKLKDSNRKAPIDKWLEFIVKKDKNFNEHLTDISCALRLIALYEPRFKDDGNIDLGDCYHVLSDCLSGEAPRHINQESSFFLFENIQKLARKMKNETNTSEEEFLEKCLKLKEVKCYSGKRKVSYYGSRKIRKTSRFKIRKKKLSC